EGPHGSDVRVARAGGFRELLTRHHAAVGGRTARLLIDPVQRPGWPHVHGDIDRRVRIHVRDTRMLRIGLSFTSRDLRAPFDPTIVRPSIYKSRIRRAPRCSLPV